MSTLRARAAASVACVPVLLAAAATTATPAHAADAYRYWAYYQLSGSTWTFATKGPEHIVPADGTVEGYRYAVGEMSTSRLPRAVVTFEQACSATPAVAGKKRVGVVIDFGRPADARDAGASVPTPYATCVTVAPEATGAQVVSAASQARIERSMVCGIDGYPATGCSDTVKALPAEASSPDTPVTIAVKGSGSASSPATASESSGGAGLWAPVGIVAVLAAGASAAWMSARRRRQQG